jgi:glycosyltransferase involved in cell wall biosynthesis
MKVDVAVLTKNSQKILRKCLDSIYKNVPVNRLIVVDGYSTDKTLEIIKEFDDLHRNIIVIQDRGTRGTARQKAIEAVETEWFMFVDSDVVLCDKWFDLALKLIEDDVGAVWGIEIWSVVRNPLVLRLFKQITMKIFESRGGTHDLLVRRKAIEDIRIPPDLHVYEDAFIKSWIRKRGYTMVSAYEPYCIHHRPAIVWTMIDSVSLVANELKFAIRYPSLLLSYAFYAAIVLHQNLLLNLKSESQGLSSSGRYKQTDT